MPLFLDAIAKNLRVPQKGFVGALVTRILKQRNGFLEEKAAEICSIQRGYHVLEVGFGPGIGLKKAATYIEKGDGMIHGIDLSPAMMVESIGNLSQEITDGKMELTLGDAASLPYRDATMDRIFHTNCYYFWPDLAGTCRELYRVLKPGGCMITLLNLDRLTVAEADGYMKYACRCDPEQYMEALRTVGFVDTTMVSTVEDSNKYETISAHKP